MDPRSLLIEELVDDLRPARRLREPLLLAGLWLAGSWLFVVALTLWAGPLRPGFAEQLASVPRFAIETAWGVLAGALAVGSAFALGVPDMVRQRGGFAAAALLLWTAGYVYGLHDSSLPPSTLGARNFCELEVLVYGTPPLLAALWLLRRLAPLHRARAGALAGAAAGAIPGLLMQLACLYVPAHILMFHIGPVAVLGLVGALLGSLVLRRI